MKKEESLEGPKYSFGALLLTMVAMFAINPFIPDKDIAVFSFHLFFTLMIFLFILKLAYEGFKAGEMGAMIGIFGIIFLVFLFPLLILMIVITIGIFKE